jgi:hypothetical protein
MLVQKRNKARFPLCAYSAKYLVVACGNPRALIEDVRVIAKKTKLITPYSSFVSSLVINGSEINPASKIATLPMK